MFKHIPCGETLPPKNVHAVSVSIPTYDDIISYEEGNCDAIKSGYPRFVLHPYLKKMTVFLKDKYALSSKEEIVLVSSKKFATLICITYNLEQQKEFDEVFGVVLIEKNSKDLQKVLRFIQHVGCNLSSRFAEEYLYDRGLIESLYVESIDKPKYVLETLRDAYRNDDIYLTCSGMNAMYGVLKALQEIRGGIVIQLGWIYLDSMNLIESYESKIFYDVEDLDVLEEFLKNNNKKISSLVTELPTNPLLQCVDVKRLKKICLKYDISLVIDSTFSTSYGKITEADILVESLTKFACGNADVLMGCFVLNQKYAKHREKFLSHIDKPYIKDVKRLAYEIKDYKKRVEKSKKNAERLVEFLKQKSFVKRVYYSEFSPVISVEFNFHFKEAYDKLNFAKGPSLGTEFTLLMPYVYLAHYDLLTCQEGREILDQNGIPIDLIRISVGIEDIEDIKKEFNRLDLW